jgi:hypothetical protein
MAFAALLVGMTLLAQSRGVVLAAIVAAGVVVAIVPGRLRRAGAVAVLLAGIAAAFPWVQDVYDAGGQGGHVSSGTFRLAAVALVLAALGAGAAWGVFTAFGSRLNADRVRLVRRGAAWGLAAAGVLALAAGAAFAGPIGDRVDHQYRAFVNAKAQDPGRQARDRLASSESNRYEYWRIAVNAFADQPVAGVGGGAYAVPYFRHRTSLEDVRQPHSLFFQVLAELGLGGLLFLGLFAGALVWALVRRARLRERLGEDALLVAAAGTLTAWWVHTSVDWIHLLPGVTGMALVAAAVVLRPLPIEGQAGVATGGAPPAQPRRLWPRVGIAVTVLALAVAAVSLSRQVLAEHYADQAGRKLDSAPRDALRLANRALNIDSDTVNTYYVKSGALARLGDGEGARGALADAVHSEPDNFVSWALLGDADVRVGRIAAARRAYGRAHALDPRDPGLGRLALDPAPGQ